MNDVSLLKATEAAVVAGVTLREMNRAIDEDIVPGEFLSLDNGRQIWIAACSLVAFYFRSAERLTAEERMKAIRWAEPRMREGRAASLQQLAAQDWRMRHGFLTVDLGPFIADAAREMEKLEAARDIATSLDDVLDGTPVFRGTRIPVHDVAALSISGLGDAAIAEIYPTLDAERIALAKIYAEAYPLRGRPRAARALPAGSKIVSDRRIARRGRAA